MTIHLLQGRRLTNWLMYRGLSEIDDPTYLFEEFSDKYRSEEAVTYDLYYIEDIALWDALVAVKDGEVVAIKSHVINMEEAQKLITNLLDGDYVQDKNDGLVYYVV